MKTLQQTDSDQENVLRNHFGDSIHNNHFVLIILLSMTRPDSILLNALPDCHLLKVDDRIAVRNAFKISWEREGGVILALWCRSCTVSTQRWPCQADRARQPAASHCVLNRTLKHDSPSTALKSDVSLSNEAECCCQFSNKNLYTML